MPYDLNRCPQTENEFTDYIYTIYQRAVGQPANDWPHVMGNSNLPHNIYTPGLKADASWPYFGATQMWSSGPRGRIFLPTALADENGYYTRQVQVIADMPGGVSGRDFIWAWTWISGHAYAPVQDATTQPPGTTPPGTVGDIVRVEVAAMIAAATAPLEARIAALEAGGGGGLQYADKVALRMASGKLVSVLAGGPTTDDQPIELVSRPEIHAHESFILEKGE